MDTSPLMGSPPPGPFYIDFQLNDGRGEADVGCHKISSVSQLHSVVSVGRTDIGLNDKKPERSSREVQVLLFRCYLRERLCLGCK